MVHLLKCRRPMSPLRWWTRCSVLTLTWTRCLMKPVAIMWLEVLAPMFLGITGRLEISSSVLAGTEPVKLVVKIAVALTLTVT